MKAKKKEKVWGYNYVIDGWPSEITKNGKPFLRFLDQYEKPQLRQVREILRVLNSCGKAKP